MATPWRSEEEREGFLSVKKSRYIDANRLNKDILASWGKDTHRTIEASLVHRQEHQHLMDIISKQPTADVEKVKRGKWRMVKYPLTECTSCYIVRNCEHEKGWNYCPNCGAKMTNAGTEISKEAYK